MLPTSLPSISFQKKKKLFYYIIVHRCNDWEFSPKYSHHEYQSKENVKVNSKNKRREKNTIRGRRKLNKTCSKGQEKEKEKMSHDNRNLEILNFM